MRHHATRRPMPVGQSVHWKPLHDSHYVVASLQPAEGGRRPIFVRQQTIARAEAVVRSSHGVHAFGLLMGQFYSCPTTGLDYLVIESLLEQHSAVDSADLATRIASAVREWREDRRAHVLGWYCGAAAVASRPSATTAEIHDSHFAQPWQTALVISEAAGSANGAFFLHDRVNARWFHAPFYELPDHAPHPNQPKPTYIAWPDYMTADPAVVVVPEPATISAPTHQQHGITHTVSRFLRPKTDHNGGPGHSTPHSTTEALPLSPLSRMHDRVVPREPVADTVAGPILPAADVPSPRPAQTRLSDVSDSREKVLARLTDRAPNKLEIVNDRDQGTSSPRPSHRITESDDTVLGDSASRFVEIARAEGFFVAAHFEAAGDTTQREMLWILNDPFSGMLLVVAAAGNEVVNASLHYNVRTDDAGLLRTPFPEHRDAESKTVYVREACLDSLRERCGQLRAAETLVREWKVSPTISFLLPSEWQSIAASAAVDHRGPAMVSELNDSRIAELPDGVRSQFHIAKAIDAHP